jgi:Tripartite tricarboxylate transporter TctB family
MAAMSLIRPLIQDVRRHGGVIGMLTDFGKPRFSMQNLFPVALLCLFAAMMTEAVTWNFYAKIVPVIVGTAAIIFCTLTLVNEVFKHDAGSREDIGDVAKKKIQEKIHMDIASNVSHLPTGTILTRGAMFFGWMVFFLCSMEVIGLIPTVPLFIVLFMRLEANEPWRIVLPMALIVCLFVYGLFDQLLAIPWPGALIGDWLPVLKDWIPSV